MWDARDIEADGVWVRVGTVQSPLSNPPVQFNPPRALPPVLPAPGCVSGIPPSGVSYSTASPAGAAQPINAEGAAAGLGLAIGTAVLVLRSATKMVS